MNALLTLPSWAALTVAVLTLAGAALAFAGSLGLLRLRQFYQRVHAPTLATTLGLYLLLAATFLFFLVGQQHAVVHVLLIGVCTAVTTPITLMLLVRAALAHERGR